MATIVAGDNYIVEETESAKEAVRYILRQYKPDVVIAGPAFEAGRYGLACAEVCREAQTQAVPAVTGMYPENPGVIAYRRDIVCVPTGTSPSEMSAVLRQMASLALKLGRGEQLGVASEEGYLPRGSVNPSFGKDGCRTGRRYVEGAPGERAFRFRSLPEGVRRRHSS